MPIKSNADKEKAIRILDYWFMMEFLDQKSLGGFKEKGEKASEYKKELKAGKNEKQKKVLEEFVQFIPEDTLQTVAEAESEEMQLPIWSDFTVFVGRVKKETCIQKIAQNAGWNRQSSDENDDEIVLATIKFSRDGRYIPYSLSISPLVWAMKKMSGETSYASQKLSIDSYNNDKRDIEAQIMNLFIHSKNDTVESEEKDLIPTLNTISYNLLKKVGDMICGELNIKEKDIDSYLAVYFKLYKTECEDENDAEVSLHMDFYSKDLEFVRQGLQNNLFTKEKEKVLIDYILGPNRYESISNEALERFDMVKPKNEEELYQFLLENLTVAKAPLGKWPSRYMPALMQQIAVNFAIDTDAQLPVFSVNGPPGTGKTTLLKEIIVNNIIEKAILLTDYDDPDEAFFDYGFKNGSDEDNSYIRFYKKYHRLKNAKINEYSMLVVSSNNTAVENITKELPVEENLLGSIKPSDAMDGLNDVALAELTHLFTVSESTKKIPFIQKEWEEYTDEEGKKQRRCNEVAEEQPDIYFSRLATDLLNAESENQDQQQAFGLISASLGKKSNIYKVETKVIEPLLDIMRKNSEKDHDTDKWLQWKQDYLDARKVFQKQLDIVRKLSVELDEFVAKEKEVSELNWKIKEKCQQIKIYKKEQIELLSGIEVDVQNQYEYIKKFNAEKNKLEIEITSIHVTCFDLEDKINQYLSDIAEMQGRVESLQNSVFIIGKLFNTAKYRRVQESVQNILRAQGELQQQVNDLENSLKEEKYKEAAVQDKINAISAKAGDADKKVKELNTRKETIKSDGGRLEDELSTLKKRVEKAEIQLENLKTKCQNQDSYDRGFVLDRQFISDIFSSDKDISTKAQIRNPWFSEHYNREREKLFLYALQMTKVFILGSKKCRDNLQHLHCLWNGGYDKNKPVKFIGEDLEMCTAAAYETLFLLIPVVSSTFASVQSFFKDVKREDLVGTLIVDEAGQATPHMAIGALYRSKKAVIVGDPKQVEPVVTQDLLTQTYEDVFFNPYKDKTNSVQRFADIINPYGTYLKNAQGVEEWVGCPLVVHRRCSSPMYEISNDISYNNIMKQQTTQPSAEKQKAFIAEKSQWINVRGKEEGPKKHFVKEQGEKVIKMLEVAFSKNSNPDVFIISPFKTVEYGIRDYLKKYVEECKKNNISSSLQDHEASLLSWLDKNVGTVHKFQGKEAAEVIFLLGCDTSDDSKTAIEWVNNNIVNVAATRAKYRFYVIGDIEAWKKSKCVKRAKKILDSFVAGSLNYERKDHKPDDGYTLVITEKPSVAEAYAKALCVWNEPTNDYYEGNGYLITWCVGHLFELAKPEDYDEKYKEWNIDDLPIIPDTWEYKIKESTQQRFSAIKELMDRPDVVDILCATDAAREGELIFRLVYQQAECKKPFRRIWLSSMEPASIRTTFDNPRPSSDYDALYEAARCRQLADWLVGMNASRFYTCRYKNEIKKFDKKTLSVGRIVSPTLAMVVEREKEIEEFVPETYYTVNLNIGGLVFKSKHISAEEETIKTFRIVEQKRSKSISSN